MTAGDAAMGANYKVRFGCPDCGFKSSAPRDDAAATQVVQWLHAGANPNCSLLDEPLAVIGYESESSVAVPAHCGVGQEARSGAPDRSRAQTGSGSAPDSTGPELVGDETPKQGSPVAMQAASPTTPST